MLFAQILAFVLVMVIFEAYQPGVPAFGLPESLLATLAVVLWLWFLGHLAVMALLRRARLGRLPNPARAATRLLNHLQLAALGCYALLVIALDLKAHYLALVPGANSDTMGGLGAILIYGMLVVVVWWVGFPLQKHIFHRAQTRGGHILGQVRLVSPILFPWLVVSICRDLLTWLVPGGQGFLDSGLGDLVFLGLFVAVLVISFPPLVKRWWGCRPLAPESRVVKVSSLVLEHLGVKVAGILDWPILEGRMLTAGIMGMLPGLRYLLITPALADNLDNEELASVVAHEAGHLRHYHMGWYLALFMGLFAMIYALTGPLDWLIGAVFYLAAQNPAGREFLTSSHASGGILGVVLALPMLVFFVVYIRFFMGWFMRHFERQADFFALDSMGRAAPLITSLEKIASLAGGLREAPSWHHFSVAQRVDALRRAEANPQVSRDLDRLIRRRLGAYVLLVALALGLGWYAGGQDLGQRMHLATQARLVQSLVSDDPHNPDLRRMLGELLMESGDEQGALLHLGIARQLRQRDPEINNALAWLLATAKDPEVRKPSEAVRLAQEAVTEKPASYIWDTLAEAYLADEQPDKAVAAGQAALDSSPPDMRTYHQEQLERFRKALSEAEKTHE